jgi:hypothetical protein
MARSAAAMEALQAIGGGTLMARTGAYVGGLDGSYARNASRAVAEGAEGDVEEGNPQDEQQRPLSSTSTCNGVLTPVPPSNPFKQAASVRPSLGGQLRYAYRINACINW